MDDFKYIIDDLIENDAIEYMSCHNGYINEEFLFNLENKFGDNAKSALKEANNDCYIAVIKLAEQIKLNEDTTKHVMAYIGKFLQDCIPNEANIDILEKILINIVGKTTNSQNRIVSDDSSIAEYGNRIQTSEQICKLLINSCNYVPDSPQKALLFLKKNKRKIASILIKAITAGNFRAEDKKYDFTGYLETARL